MLNDLRIQIRLHWLPQHHLFRIGILNCVFYSQSNLNCKNLMKTLVKYQEELMWHEHLYNRPDLD